MAQGLLGGCYLEGKGVKQDDAEAFKWCKLAADNGYGEAMFVTSLCYRDGTRCCALVQVPVYCRGGNRMVQPLDTRFNRIRAKEKVTARNLRARPRRSQTAADAVGVDVCSNDAEIVSYLSYPTPVIAAKSMIIPDANGMSTESGETVDREGAGGAGGV